MKKARSMLCIGTTHVLRKYIWAGAYLSSTGAMDLQFLDILVL